MFFNSWLSNHQKQLAQRLRARRSRLGNSFRPKLERLEDRRLLTTLLNQAPAFDPVAAQTIEQGQRLQLRVTASDLDTLSATARLTSGTSVCSGVLISREQVLTAAHCLVDGETTVTFEDSAVTRTVARSAQHPSYDPIRNFDKDLAVVTLDDPVDIAPLALYRQAAELHSPMLLSGFGSDTFHFGANRVQEIQSSLLVFNSASPVVFHIVSGDSGGPALINGQVAGVAAFEFGQQYAYTRVSQFQSFIDATITDNEGLHPLALTFALVNGPAGATFDPGTTTFAWTPGAEVQPGTYFATLRVTDNGATPLSDEITFAIDVLPGQPAIDVGPDAFLDEGGTFSTRGTYAFLPGRPVSARVDYGDTSVAENLPLDLAAHSFVLNHRYETDGFFRPTVTITDDLGNQTSGSARVFVNNVAPHADAGGPYSAPEGGQLKFDANSSFDPGHDIVSYEWGFFSEDSENPCETIVGTGPILQLDVPRNAGTGEFEIELRVTDDDGASSLATATYTITAGPRLAAVDDAFVVAMNGAPARLDVLANDISPLAEAVLAINSVYPAEHGSVTLLSLGRGLFYTPDPNFVGVDSFGYGLSDGQGHFAAANVTVTVRLNHAPTAVLESAPALDVSPLAIRFDGRRSSDPDAGDAVQRYLWDFGDGSSAETSEPGTVHAYSHTGSFHANLVVVDALGVRSDSTSRLIFLNARPTADLTAALPALSDPLTVMLDGRRSSDPDAGDRIVQYRWDFGDGQTALTTDQQPTIAHAYPGAGDFHATLTVVDTFGAASTPAAFLVRTRGTISGNVFEDDDGNGQQDRGDARTGGVIVYVDLNHSGQRDTGEPFAASDAASGGARGFYSLSLLGGTGSYEVRLDLPATQLATLPGNKRVVDLHTAARADDVPLGFFSRGTVSGVAFDDEDGNGKKAGNESVLAGVQLYLDADNDQRHDPDEPTTFSDASGKYKFLEQAGPGTQAVRAVALGAGQFVTSDGGGVGLDLQSGESLANRNLGIFTRGSVSGKVFEDLDADGKLGANDPGVAGRRVYVDLNGDGVLNPDELPFSTLTDRSGNYVLDRVLGPGKQKISHVSPAAWTVSTPKNNLYSLDVTSGSSFSDKNFGGFKDTSIAGTIGEDLNANGKLEAGEPKLKGWQVFLDLNQNGTRQTDEPLLTTDSDGAFLFTDLKPGTYRVREVPPAGWFQDDPKSVAQDRTLISGQAATDAVFANYRPGTIAGTVFDDFNGDEKQDTGEVVRSDRTVYLDSNGNGAKDTGEPATLTNLQGTYSFGNLKPGAYSVRTVPAAGEAITAPSSGAHSVTLISNQTLSRPFAMFKLGTIFASVVVDRNGDGSLANDNGGAAGRRLFLDINHNGRFDSGEPDHVTTSAAQSGSTVSFNSLLAGNYNVLIEPQGGWVTTTPVVQKVTINSGTLGGTAFGLFELGSIAGKVLQWTSDAAPANEDLDLHPGNLTPLADRVVYLDQNNNGRPDTGETSSVTDRDGHYFLPNVGPGFQHVREVLPPGWISQPFDAAQEVPMSSGVARSVPYAFPEAHGTYFENKYIGVVSGTVREISRLGDLGLAGVTVFIDDNNNGAPDSTDNNGVIDAGEATATTAADGRFVLTRPTNLSFQLTFAVRLLMPLGYRMDASVGNSSPSFQTLTLASNLGTRPSDIELPRVFKIAAFADPFPIADDFDRPASTTVLGDDWREVAGDMVISAPGSDGQLQGSSGGDIALYNSLPVSDVKLTADIGGNGFLPLAGLVSRYQLATGDRYIGLIVQRSGQRSLEIQKVVGGVTTVLASAAITATSGLLGFETTGNQLKLQFSGLTLIATDGTLSQPGLMGVFIGPNGVLDNFSAAQPHA